MSFKMSGSDFQLLASYVEKKAKGSDLTLTFQQNSFLEVKLANAAGEPVTISIYPENGNASSFAKISVSRRLGDEIK